MGFNDSMTRIPHSNNITWIQEYDTIIIQNVTEEHRGVYECTAQNEAGVTKKQIPIEVHTRPVITDLRFTNERVLERSEVKLQCKASGRPRPRITVNKLNEELSLNVLKQNIDDLNAEYNLIFEKVLRTHSGVYFCKASNKVDYVVQEINLTVLYKPTFEETREIHYAWMGKQIVLNCDYDSVPESDVSWRYFGNIKGSENNEFLAYVSKFKEVNLTIFDDFDLGTFECTANNLLGQANKTFEVKKGFIPPKFNIAKVTISHTTATSATFAIEDHYSPGPKLTGYIAVYDLTSAYEEISVHPNRTWAHLEEYTLLDLQPGNSYTIQFAAQNEMGNGVLSDTITFDTPDKSVPEQPQLEENSANIEISANQQVLKLQPAQDNGSPITYYTVKICQVDEKQNKCLKKNMAPTTEVQLEDFNLKPNSTYFVELEAHNSLGKSKASYVQVTVTDLEGAMQEELALTAGAIIGISIIIAIICILLLDLLLYFTLKKGIIATCYQKKNKKSKEDGVTSRDKKGLLKDNNANGENETMKRDNGHKEFEYNKETGIVTGKHSAV